MLSVRPCKFRANIPKVQKSTFIYAISKQYIFDVEDMFLRILKDSAQYPFCLKVFAPWIKKVIDHAMRTVYLVKESHKSFIPPIHDTLQIMEDISSGKSPASIRQDYHKQFDGPRLPRRSRKILLQPPSQLEVSLRTQQLLLQHIRIGAKRTPFNRAKCYQQSNQNHTSNCG